MSLLRNITSGLRSLFRKDQVDRELNERRTNEIGIRVALGADRANVLGLVLRAALTQLGLGLAIGIPAALAGGHLLAHQLYGVKSYDPTILGAAALVLAACAILAASIPARRATRVDPKMGRKKEIQKCLTCMLSGIALA
jgi:predicted lysophospholipase L1 biosynthesis ABC-type transport system permease subunit